LAGASKPSTFTWTSASPPFTQEGTSLFAKVEPLVQGLEVELRAQRFFLFSGSLGSSFLGSLDSFFQPNFQLNTSKIQ
jgi:hypothetical protein